MKSILERKKKWLSREKETSTCKLVVRTHWDAISQTKIPLEKKTCALGLVLIRSWILQTKKLASLNARPCLPYDPISAPGQTKSVFDKDIFNDTKYIYFESSGLFHLNLLSLSLLKQPMPVISCLFFFCYLDSLLLLLQLLLSEMIGSQTNDVFVP